MIIIIVYQLSNEYLIKVTDRCAANSYYFNCFFIYQINSVFNGNTKKNRKFKIKRLVLTQKRWRFSKKQKLLNPKVKLPFDLIILNTSLSQLITNALSIQLKKSTSIWTVLRKAFKNFNFVYSKIIKY